MNSNLPAREGHFNPTSPHSSSGAAESFKGTPETRLTAFSPEDGSSKASKAPQPLSIGNRESGPIRFAANNRNALELPNTFVRSNLHAERGDPFVSSTLAAPNRSSSQKLSPTASVFLPYPSPLTNISSNATIGQLMHEATESEQVHDQQAVTRVQQPRGPHNVLSTDTNLARCLIIADPGRRLGAVDVAQYISTLESNGVTIHGRRQICESDNQVFVRFVNIRDAIGVLSSIHAAPDLQWMTSFISPREFSQAIEPGSGAITIHEGQIYLNVFATQVAILMERDQLELVLKELLQEEGDLFAFKVDPTTGAEGSLFSAIAEYCDNDVSLRAVSRFNNVVIEGGFQVCVTLYRPDIPSYTSVPTGLVSPARTATTASDIANDFQRLSLTRAPSTVPGVSTANALLSTPVRTPGLHMQPYGMLPILYSMASPPYLLDHLPSRPHAAAFSPGGYPMMSPLGPRPSPYTSRDLVTQRQLQQSFNRRQNATRVNRSPYYQQSNSHNHVDISRIEEGTDVRTTIMLRNIPNKVDQAMLKGIVDESSWGKYDFMYLRIDFANDCNVGYAFINFVDPLDIVDFVNARGNQRWNCFKSDKVAEISYATIQGKDCLVQKFRNSSVMLEAPHYRPKLYYTVNGPRPDQAGKEESFPGPDNQSKMKRSCENAEHVGLFTPNAGQHFRDEQRRRRSQYDRGTRMAAFEEYDYDAALHHNFYSPQ
ncbi:RNA recognition motif 2-domain-containing protein [Xylariaceae sp. FL1019]|nr:RNA recognition motif 2-domain-containing protein [Xylariaceae sp. FL1019]